MYKTLWRNITGLMRMVSHVNVTFRLARLWFILITLVMHRHLELAASSKIFLYSFLISFSLNPLQTGERLWEQLRNSGLLCGLLRGLHSDMFQRHTAHCATVVGTQTGEGLPFLKGPPPLSWGLKKWKWTWSHSVMSESLRPHGL